VNDTTDVRFWDVRRNRSSKSASYEVRWVVGGRQFSRTRATKALAENFLSELRQAAKRGEAFDTGDGLPASMRRAKRAMSWFAFVLAYVDVKWPRAAAKTRDSMTDALATVTAALVDDRPGQPEVLLVRRALRQYALVPSSRTLPRPAEVTAALGWLERASLPLTELEKPRNVRLELESAVRGAGVICGRSSRACTSPRCGRVRSRRCESMTAICLRPGGAGSSCRDRARSRTSAGPIAGKGTTTGA